MSEIIVNSLYLRNLAWQVRQFAAQLRSTNMTRGFEQGLCRSPEVWAEFQNLDERWDERRDRIAALLEELASGFENTRESFEQADAELAQGLAAGRSD